MKFAILGGGSWGSALAITLAKNNNSVKVWEFFPEQAQEMQEKRVCKLLPDATLPDNIFISHKIEEVLFDTEAVLLVVPSDKVEATIGNAKHLFSDQPVIICSKGFGEGLQLLSESVQKQVGGNAYCLYGPTHAEEVCHGMFSGIVLAGKEGKERQLLQEAFHSPVFNVEVSDDIIGVQLCAALKNILAVFGCFGSSIISPNCINRQKIRYLPFSVIIFRKTILFYGNWLAEIIFSSFNSNFTSRTSYGDRTNYCIVFYK